MTSAEDKNIDPEMPGLERKPFEASVKLGKRLNLAKNNEQLRRHLYLKGMSKVDLIAQWEHMIGKIYADHSLPILIKTISGVRTLICKVRYTRVLEFQYQKEDFIKQINLFAGSPVIQDIKFERTDKLPKKRPKLSSIISNILPDTKHPKLSDIKTNFNDKDLHNAFNVLAYLIMPVENDKKPSFVQQSPDIINSWRERAKILLNSCDK